MACAAKRAASARALQVLAQPRTNITLLDRHWVQQQRIKTIRAQSHQIIRHASSSTKNPPDPSKPIVLEKPDKFRPPSHAARRNVRSTTGTYGMGGAYNQGMSERERNASKQKSYPNMFPAEGTTMHWFLTTRWIHLFITMMVLLTLAFTSNITTWYKTSPFAHLLPPASMFFWHPLNYISEVFSVFRLHVEYNTDRVAEHRHQNMLDARKRRIYRRAHGMEDLDADEVSGPDIRGLVEWDDGLTNKERERGGQFGEGMMGRQMQAMGQLPGEDVTELLERKRREQEEMKVRKEQEREKKRVEEEREEEERLIRISRRRREEERPKRKLWLGIW